MMELRIKVRVLYKYSISFLFYYRINNPTILYLWNNLIYDWYIYKTNYYNQVNGFFYRLTNIVAWSKQP